MATGVDNGALQESKFQRKWLSPQKSKAVLENIFFMPLHGILQHIFSEKVYFI